MSYPSKESKREDFPDPTFPRTTQSAPYFISRSISERTGLDY